MPKRRQTMAKTFIALCGVAACAVASLAGASHSTKRAPDMVEVRPQAKGFSGLSFSGVCRVQVTKGPNTKLVLRVNREARPHLRWAVTNKVLRVWMENVKRGSRVHCSGEVVMPSLVSVRLSGVTNMSLKGFSQKGTLRGRLSGTSQLIGGASYERLDMRVSGASRLRWTGPLRSMEARISGSSSFVLTGKVQRARVRLSGVSRATLHVVRVLRARLSGVSQLHLQGRPTLHLRKSGISRLVRM